MAENGVIHMAEPTVVLFDIDGTLVTTGGAGRLAIERAFESEFGRPDACRHFRFDGLTDWAIARRALEFLGLEPEDDRIERLFEVYLRNLAKTVDEIEAHRYRIHPGMIEAVEAAHARNMAVGLGTGNIRRGAQIKLERVDLFHRFDFGGFGDDAEIRSALIKIGAQRGASRLGLTIAEVRIVIVGDTPHDVTAALAIGGQCLAVSTGSFSIDELRAAGATWAFESLASPGALEALLGTDG